MQLVKLASLETRSTKRNGQVVTYLSGSLDGTPIVVVPDKSERKKVKGKKTSARPGYILYRIEREEEKMVGQEGETGPGQSGGLGN